MSKSKTMPVQKITIAAILIAVGIIIPIFSPLKIPLYPASFTLASHVAVFIAMFVSPVVAGSVAIGTTIGFLLGGFPIVVVLRAATHLVFALGGAFYLQKHPYTLNSVPKSLTFSFLIGLLHAACEVVVCTLFYFGGALDTGNYETGFIVSIVLLVGVGSVIHSMVDFAIAQLIGNVLIRQRPLQPLFSIKLSEKSP